MYLGSSSSVRPTLFSKFISFNFEYDSLFLQDSSYPLYLYQALEDCWKQEHYNRPPAEDLCRVLMKLTGLKFSENTCSCQEMTAILLDSYTLHPDKRIARSEVTCTDGKVDICVAMATRDDTSTTIATIKYQDDIRSELALEVRNNTLYTRYVIFVWWKFLYISY